MLPPWTPDLASLDLLVSVAELGSVGRAAAAHEITQPSASARLSRLERRLQLTLLVRTSRGSTLTPAGEVVVGWARTVVESARALTEGARSLGEQGDTRLRVAASLTVAEYLLPSWLLALQRRHHDLDVAATVKNSEQVTHDVREGVVDVGFVESPGVPGGLHSMTVGNDRLALVVGAVDPLAAHATTGLAPADLLSLTLLLREPGSGTRATFLTALDAALGTPSAVSSGTAEPPAPPHAVALGSTATILTTARACGGAAVISARAVAADIASGALVEIPVHGLVAERPLTAIWRTKTPSALAQELIALAMQSDPGLSIGR